TATPLISGLLRVASAQVYSIVKNRDMEHFEKVMGFLEATYRLLPRLVTPIKHMKVMFGLKTMPKTNLLQTQPLHFNNQ
uniref:TERF1-interacting nuclear factor 2 N-terminal domain-containing protein n=1 Tax=Seriola dumerili TaxID=41447 RepID=A0A3B4TKC9_SERDU